MSKQQSLVLLPSLDAEDTDSSYDEQHACNNHHVVLVAAYEREDDAAEEMGKITGGLGGLGIPGLM